MRNIQCDYSNTAESLSNASFNKYYVVETIVQFIYINERHPLNRKCNNHESDNYQISIVNTNVMCFEDYGIKIDVSINGQYLAYRS